MIHDPKMDSDDAISTELARANLARLRGDYSAAEDQCVQLLQKAPHNANVAALLGDVSLEQGKLEASVQWYGMAVDSGAPVGIAEKLIIAKERLKQRDAEASEAGIGLPSRTAFSPATLLAGVIVILMLFVGAFVAGTYRSPSKQTPQQDQPPIVVPASPSSTILNPTQQDQNSAAPTNNQLDNSGQRPAEAHVPNPPPAKPNIDANLMPYFGDDNSSLANSQSPLARVSSAIGDPRSHSLIMDVQFQQGDDERAIAAQVAEAAFGKLKDISTVTLRILNGGKPEYVADGTREKYDAYVHGGHIAGTGAELADALLSNEWKAGNEATTTGR